MKKIMILISLLLLAVSAVSAQNNPGTSVASQKIKSLAYDPIQLTIPEVGKEVQRLTLDNGLVVFLYEDHRFPIFQISTMIRCGSIYEPAGKEGLADLVGTVMRTGGTMTMSGDSLNNTLEQIGGSLETGIGQESGWAALTVLARDTELGLKLYADLLRHPAFPQDKIDLAKTDIKSGIKRRNDNPRGIVDRQFYNIIYGDHPYGRILEWATVKDIAREDMIAYHRRFFTPDHIIVGIYGDFDPATVMAKLKEHLADWQKSADPLPAPPPVSFEHHPGVYLVNKDINQGYIKIGLLGIKRDNPERYAIQLLNYILGAGSFTSRLTSRVRSDEGLAYHVSSDFDTDKNDFGIFCAQSQTKSSTTYKAIRIIVDEIEKLRSEGVTEDELNGARDAVINKVVFLFDSPEKIIRNLMSLEYDGEPLDYYKGYLDHFRKVTLADLKMVAAKYLDTKQMSFVVVGKPDSYEKPLDEFGAVTRIELTEPQLD